jgi:hypothetical protein
MARFNELLAARYNRFLQKLFVLKGGPPSPQLASEIIPTFPFFNGAENRYLEGWNRFGYGLEVLGAVGNPSQLRIRNPTGSGVIAVLESIILDLATNDRVQLTYTKLSTDFTVQTVVPLDGRTLSTSSSLIISNSNASASAGNVVYQDMHMFNTVSPVQLTSTENQEIPITPGIAWGVQTVSANVLLSANVIWRERALEESERF